MDVGIRKAGLWLRDRPRGFSVSSSLRQPCDARDGLALHDGEVGTGHLREWELDEMRGTCRVEGRGPHKGLRGPSWPVDIAGRELLNGLSSFKQNKREERKFGDTSEVEFIRPGK